MYNDCWEEAVGLSLWAMRPTGSNYLLCGSSLRTVGLLADYSPLLSALHFMLRGLSHYLCTVY